MGKARVGLGGWLLRIAGVIVVFPVILFCLFLLFGSDYSINLPNGYYLSRNNAAEIILAGPKNSVLVEPNITGYKVLGDLVVGLAEPPELPDVRMADSLDWGYFVLDSKSGDLQKGLNAASWLRILADRGMKERPRLKEPSRFDNIFGSP